MNSATTGTAAAGETTATAASRSTSTRAQEENVDEYFSAAEEEDLIMTGHGQNNPGGEAQVDDDSTTGDGGQYEIYSDADTGSGTSIDIDTGAGTDTDGRVERDIDINDQDSSNQQTRTHIHEYLPGEAHPLCSPEFYKTHQQHYCNGDGFQHGHENAKYGRMSVPILTLPPSVILFPGSTLPLRLQSSSAMAKYLQKAINRLEHEWLQFSPSNIAEAAGVEEYSSLILPNNNGNGNTALPSKEQQPGVVAIGLLPWKEEGDDNDDRNNDSTGNANVSTNSNSNVVGRIGTLAIVTHVSRHDESSGTTQEQEHGNELVATSLGM
jgi:hypothetical protein